MTHCGRQLKLLRDKLGLSQKQLGHKLGLKNGQFISNIEKGLCLYPIGMLKQLSKLYRDIDLKPLVDAYLEDKKKLIWKTLGKTKNSGD